MTATTPGTAPCLQAALDAYEADFALMPPSLQPDVYQLVELDLEAVRCLVADAARDVKERWRCLVDAHVLLTDAILKNLLAAAAGHEHPVPDAELTDLREAHAAALAALRAGSGVNGAAHSGAVRGAGGRHGWGLAHRPGVPS